MSSKRHHYVPQFYLRYFLPIIREKRATSFWVYDKNGGPPHQQTPLNTAVESHFYSFDIPGEEPRDVVEQMLSSLESNAKPILDRWQIPRATPNMDEVSEMAIFLAFIHARVPRTVKTVKELGEALAVANLKDLAENPNKLKKYWEKYRKDRGNDDTVTFEQMQDSLRNFEKRFYIKMNKKKALSFSILHALEIYPYLLKMNWCLCSAPHGSFFLTSDMPINVFAWTGRNRAIFGGGVALESAEVAFPICPDICLLLDHQHTQKHRRVSKKVVKEINRRTVWMAERFVISPFNTKYVGQLVTRFSITRQMPKIKREDVMWRYREFKSKDWLGKET